MVDRKNITIPEVVDMYKASVQTVAPNFGFGNEVGIGHAVVTEGGKTLRMSGYPAISTDGIVGKGDMGVQMTQALENVRMTVEEAGATVDDIVHYLFYFTDREQFWNRGIPSRAAFFNKYSKTKELPCVTSIMVAGLMTPDMMIEVEATAVFD